VAAVLFALLSLKTMGGELFQSSLVDRSAREPG
jgi:hypothetical protein